MNYNKKVLLVAIVLSIASVVATKVDVQDAKKVVDDAQAKYAAAVKVINAYMAAPNPTDGTLKAGYSGYKQAVQDVLQYAQSYIDNGLADIVTTLTVLDVLPKDTDEIQKLEKDLNNVVTILKPHVSTSGRPPFSRLTIQSLLASDQPPAATAEDEFGSKVVPLPDGTSSKIPG